MRGEEREERRERRKEEIGCNMVYVCESGRVYRGREGVRRCAHVREKKRKRESVCVHSVYVVRGFWGAYDKNMANGSVKGKRNNKENK